MARTLKHSDRENYAADVFCGFVHLAGGGVIRRGPYVLVSNDRRAVQVLILVSRRSGFRHKVSVPRPLERIVHVAVLQASTFSLCFVRLPKMKAYGEIELTDMAGYAPAIHAEAAVGTLGYELDGKKLKPLASIGGLF